MGAAAGFDRRTCPQGHRSEFKREFGDDSAISRLGGRAYRPDDLAALVLGFLREQALDQCPGEPDAVVITVPAAWERGNRDRMHAVAMAAGYPPGRVELRSEPVAAAAYACADHSDDRCGSVDLVYDLGGGTFDVAVARRTGQEHQVLGSPDGLSDVGGVEFDRLIMDRIRVEHPAEVAALFDPGGDGDVVVLRHREDLRELCEGLKCRLAVQESATDLLTPLGLSTTFELTRAGFADLAGGLIEETIDVCARLLDSVGLAWSDLGTIYPVGGSSRLPLVRQRLESRYGRSVAVVDTPELAIVQGAVILAGALAWPTAKPSTSPPAGPRGVERAAERTSERGRADSPSPEPVAVPQTGPPDAPRPTFRPDHNPFDEY